MPTRCAFHSCAVCLRSLFRFLRFIAAPAHFALLCECDFRFLRDARALFVEKRSVRHRLRYACVRFTNKYRKVMQVPRDGWEKPTLQVKQKLYFI